MKVKNFEKFVGQLFENIKVTAPVDCDVHELLKVEFTEDRIKPENKSKVGIRYLNNPLMIEKISYDRSYNRVVDSKIFLKVYEDCIRFFRENTETQCFEHVPFTTIDFEDYPTQTQFMMRVAMKIQKFSMEGKV